MPRKLNISKYVIEQILKEYPHVGNVELGLKYGLGVSYLSGLARDNGVKKTLETKQKLKGSPKVTIGYCEDTKKRFIELFPVMRNSDLSKLFDISIHTIEHYSYKYKLVKKGKDNENKCYEKKLELAKSLGYKSVSHAHASMLLHEFDKIFKNKL